MVEQGVPGQMERELTEKAGADDDDLSRGGITAGNGGCKSLGDHDLSLCKRNKLRPVLTNDIQSEFLVDWTFKL